MRRVGCGEKRLIHRTPSDENTLAEAINIVCLQWR